MRSLKILVVDDDPDFAEGLALYLELAGHKVEIAVSGEEAIGRFSRDEFDITFMDVRMPGINGVDSFFEFRKIKPHARVVMMTAYSVEHLLRSAIDGGALGVMQKPFGSEDLLQMLEKVKPSGVVLLADDDREFAECLETVLANAGYAITVAHTGREAVDTIRDDGFDVLILDLRLPVLNGLEVYLELQKFGRELPTIIVTGYEIEEAEKLTALQAKPVAGYLRKPFDSTELLKAIDVIMSQQTAEGA